MYIISKIKDIYDTQKEKMRKINIKIEKKNF